MDTGITGWILAIITTNPGLVYGSGCPVFLAADQEEQQKISLYMARILGGVVHDLENGVYFVCRH
ncbi:MAG: capping complex subunit for YIEGIA [Deltaproteobacteria bacterium]